MNVVYAVTSSGSPGCEFIVELSSSDQAKMFRLFSTIAEHGKINNREHFKKIEGTVFFEFKCFKIRMPCYYLPGKLLVITHGFLKYADRIPKSEIDRAESIQKEDAALAAKDAKGQPKKWKR